jgi:DNA transformation protein
MDADFIRDLFRSFRPVAVRRMFGGAGIYADGVMFALLSSGGTLYLKIGENNEADFIRENLPPFAPMMKSGRHAVMPYRQMPERLYDDPDELAQWAAKALHAAAAKSRPGPRKVAAKQEKAAGKGPAAKKNSASRKKLAARKKPAPRKRPASGRC